MSRPRDSTPSVGTGKAKQLANNLTQTIKTPTETVLSSSLFFGVSGTEFPVLLSSRVILSIGLARSELIRQILFIAKNAYPPEPGPYKSQRRTVPGKKVSALIPVSVRIFLLSAIFVRFSVLLPSIRRCINLVESIVPVSSEQFSHVRHVNMISGENSEN